MKENRLLLLLRFLLEQPDYISTKEIAAHLQVSARTIYSDMNAMPFKKLLGGAFIEKKPKLGIKLIATETQVKKYTNSRINFKIKDREASLFLVKMIKAIFYFYSLAAPDR